MASSWVSLAFAESQTSLKHWACPYLLQACAQHQMGTHCLQGGFMKRRAVVVQETLLLRAPCVWHVGWIIMARKKKKSKPKEKLRKYASSLIFQSINIKHTVGASRLVWWLGTHLPEQGSGKAPCAAERQARVHRSCWPCALEPRAELLSSPSPLVQWLGTHLPEQGSGKTPRAAERQARVHRSC